MKLILFAMITMIGLSASASMIVRDEEAKKMYNDLVLLQSKQPADVNSYVSQYFGDASRPQLGRLWVTTIYNNKDKNVFCFEYNFKTANIVEYICEIRN
jgi:hypothetical protein